eukprot:6945614-Lingulodinium_polyedra.AAC.1
MVVFRVVYNPSVKEVEAGASGDQVGQCGWAGVESDAMRIGSAQRFLTSFVSSLVYPNPVSKAGR